MPSFGTESTTWPCRRICDARKALYASKITLTDELDASATSAPAQRLVSQLKRLEVSGTAGNLVEPAPEVGLLTSLTGAQTCTLQPCPAAGNVRRKLDLCEVAMADLWMPQVSLLDQTGALYMSA